MSGAGEPRISIFSEPLCDSDKGDSRPQADNHVGENFGGSVWSPRFSLCSRPCLVSTAGALRVSIPAHPLQWRGDAALGHLGIVNHKTAASKEPTQINKGRKDWIRFYNSEALVHHVQLRICSQTAFAVERFVRAFIPRVKGNFWGTQSSFFFSFPSLCHPIGS